ncbi:uncharacterized protein LOC110466313 isoform X2 [Mizuhopecten yessoensis]|uniref:uncharacterized protein LOC110466313 isoform X2 n=1 Tax=Mizuhopecten yessoensis TaxID=6573 RepID=UPI000B45F7BA|nr:uncharacterized protein LOC110466313 isoform X2 [Mizuhopecten yessoensis]
MLWTIVVFSLLCVVCDHIQSWVIEPSVFTVYRTKHSWNEARQICENNNNTLLTIPDEHYWTFWKFVLNPEGEALYRNIDNSRYWFGLHAPDPNNKTSLVWVDCDIPSWIEWTSAGRNYEPEHQCLAFDVYFKPFTTILLKIWLADNCPTDNYFVCSEPLSSADGACITHGCDEYVRVVTDNNQCIDMCQSYPECRTNFTSISGLGICHVFNVTANQSSAFYRMCLLYGNKTINTCSNDNGFGDTSNINNVDPYPTGICLPEETTSVQSTSTDETSAADMTTTDVLTTTEVLRTTTTTSTSQPMCVCPCSIVNGPELTIEEKVELLKKELTVNKKTTSLHKRKFISASDDRISATGIGSFGVGMLAIVLISICIMDLGTLKADFHNMYNNVRSCCCRNKKESRVRHVRHDDPSIPKVRLFTDSSCPVVVSATTSPTHQNFKDDISLQRNDMTMLSVPTNNAIAKTQNPNSSLSSGSTSSMTMGSRSSSNRTGTDQSSNNSPEHHSSLSIQSSSTSGNASRKSLARSSSKSPMNKHMNPCYNDVPLCKSSNDDHEADMLPNRIISTELHGRHLHRRDNSKEPIWLRMV